MWWLGVGAVFCLLDGFSGAMTARREWEIVVGLVLAVLAAITYWIRGDED